VSFKRKQWEALVGKKEFNSLSKKLQKWLIKSAGLINLGRVNLKEIYKIDSFYEENNKTKPK